MGGTRRTPRRRGAGAAAQCCRTPSIGVSGFAPVWARSILSEAFRRRASSCVCGVRSRRRCYRRRCCASERGAWCVRREVWRLRVLLSCGCGCRCGGVCAATLAMPGARAVQSARATAACVRALGAKEGGGSPVLAASGAYRCCASGVYAAPPVPVLEMPLMPPQVVGAVAATESPLCSVHARGVASAPRGAAARGAAAVLAWRWR